MLACPCPPGYHRRQARNARTRPAVIDTVANAVRVLQITDPHLFAEPNASLRGTVTDDSLRSVLAHIAAAGWQADFIAMTGDLIQDDSRGAYERFREHFANLGLPILCVPGNHDVRELMQDELADEPFRYCGSVRSGDWLVLGIDSCRTGSAGGAVSEHEFARVADAVDETDAEHVLVCLHHPPLPVGSRWLDQVGLDNGPELIERFAASGKIRGCLFGHVHQAVDETRNGLRIIGTPSTCRQFLPDSDDFALDDRPPAYRRLALRPDGSIDEELVWVDGDARDRGA